MALGSVIAPEGRVNTTAGYYGPVDLTLATGWDFDRARAMMQIDDIDFAIRWTQETGELDFEFGTVGDGISLNQGHILNDGTFFPVPTGDFNPLIGIPPLGPGDDLNFASYPVNVAYVKRFAQRSHSSLGTRHWTGYLSIIPYHFYFDGNVTHAPGNHPWLKLDFIYQENDNPDPIGSGYEFLDQQGFGLVLDANGFSITPVYPVQASITRSSMSLPAHP